MSIAARFFLVLAVLFASPAMADKLTDEIIYRVNLGRADDVKLLLEQGASADLTNDDGVPLIALASARKDEEGVKVLDVLLAAGANVNAQDAQGKTALFYAVKKANKPVIKRLLDAKINYYAIDNRGDIARTVAFREGYTDVVTMLDAFVREETLKVNKQYEDATAEIAKRYEQQRKEAEARNQELVELEEKTKQQKAALEEEIKKNAAAGKAPVKSSDSEGVSIMTPIPDATPANNVTQELLRRSQKLAYHSCALQYWYFCRETKQPVEMGDRALEKTIEAEKDNILNGINGIAALNPDPADFPQKLSERAKKLIFDQLDGLTSRRYRKEQGVGSLADMGRRCGIISEQWQIVPTDTKLGKDVPVGTGQGVEGRIAPVSQ